MRVESEIETDRNRAARRRARRRRRQFVVIIYLPNHYLCTAMSNLDSFIKSSRPPPQRIQESREITDRESTFVASIYRARSTTEVRTCVKHLKQVIHAPNPASHEITAWRCMMVKSGKTGLGGEEDFELHSGCEDDGENWAGARVLKVRR